MIGDRRRKEGSRRGAVSREAAPGARAGGEEATWRHCTARRLPA